MTHNVPNFAAQDAVDLHARIDREAATEDPRKRRLPWQMEIAIAVAEATAMFFQWFESLPRVAMYSVMSITGTSVMMAAVPRFVDPGLAALGMALMFIVCIPVSFLYWMRYDREEQQRELLNTIMESIADLDSILNEKLDAVVRNVV